MIPLVDLKSQYQSIKDEIDHAIADVVESCHFVLGPQVEAFEADFAAYCETRFACAVNSGTSALHLALLAAGVGPGDEVITVSYTFVATAAAILYTGARPVFVDIDPRTCNIDPAKIESAITPRTKVIMPVHLYGNCADMDPIMEIAASPQSDCDRGRGPGARRLNTGAVAPAAWAISLVLVFIPARISAPTAKLEQWLPTMSGTCDANQATARSRAE